MKVVPGKLIRGSTALLAFIGASAVQGQWIEPLPPPPEVQPTQALPPAPAEIIPTVDPDPWTGPQIGPPTGLPPCVFCNTPPPTQTNPANDLPTYRDMNPNTDAIPPTEPVPTEIVDPPLSH